MIITVITIRKLLNRLNFAVSFIFSGGPKILIFTSFPHFQNFLLVRWFLQVDSLGL